MKSLGLVALFFCIVSTSCSFDVSKKLTGLPESSLVNSLDTAQAQALFDCAQYFPNGTQLAIAIIRDSAVCYVGVERRNDSLVYIENRDSVFEIGSITKTFTGTMLARLIAEKQVSGSDSIAKYLPVPLHQPSLNGQAPTLVQLADHTSGLPVEPTNVRNDNGEFPNPDAPYQAYSVAQLYDYLANRQILLSTPGEKRLYSNLGAGLLGHILTLVSGQSYQQYLFESISTPLNMEHTFVERTPERERLMVKGRDAKGNPLPLGAGDCGALTGCGGIKSSAADLVKYLQANFTDTTYFYLAQLPTTKFTENFSGALGWAPYAERGKVHQGAYGGTPGYTCGVIFERNTRVGVVVLTNVSNELASKGNYIEQFCRALYDPLPFENAL